MAKKLLNQTPVPAFSGKESRSDAADSSRATGGAGNSPIGADSLPIKADTQTPLIPPVVVQNPPTITVSESEPDEPDDSEEDEKDDPITKETTKPSTHTDPFILKPKALTKGEIDDAIWRARLHYQSLVSELELMLSDPTTCAKLKVAAQNAQCRMPGRVRDWKALTILAGVITELTGKKIEA